MMISARRATRVLELAGLGGRQARRVLACGLAGPPVATRAALLYDADRVAELAGRPEISDATADAATPGGLFVARRDVDVLAPEDQQRGSLQGGWGFSPVAAVLVRIRVEQHGHVPLVATVGGFVAAGAEILEVLVSPEGYHLVLQEAGPWFATFRGRRFATGPGRPWVLRDRLGWQHPSTDAA